MQDHIPAEQDHISAEQDHISLGHIRCKNMILRAEQDHISAEQSIMGFLQDAKI